MHQAALQNASTVATFTGTQSDDMGEMGVDIALQKGVPHGYQVVFTPWCTCGICSGTGEPEIFPLDDATIERVREELEETEEDLPGSKARFLETLRTAAATTHHPA